MGINTITYSDLDYNVHPDDVEFSLDMAENLFTFSENANALVGCFDYECKKALYVVNYDMAQDQRMTLTFKDTV